MNREYAYNRDRVKFKVYVVELHDNNRISHRQKQIKLRKVNKVGILVWMYIEYHGLVISKKTLESLEIKKARNSNGTGRN